MPESLLIMCQAGSWQPYLKRDFDADFFPVNAEEFSKGLVKTDPIFLQHKNNAMLNEMLDRFNRTQKKKKSCLMKKNHVG